MTVKVLFFASCRDIVGTGEDEMTLPAGATVAALVKQVVEAHPRFGEMAPSLMVSVNQEYVEGEGVLKEGDEVAFIPPVSGGVMHRRL